MTDKIEYKPLNVLGTVYHTTLTKKYKSRKEWTRPNEKLVSSLIPGTVLDIFVEAGASVKKGDIIMLLESMKMENKILAPFDGIIKSVHVEKGQVVPKNELMIEFE